MRNAKDLLPGNISGLLAQRLALHRLLLDIVRRALPSYLQNHCLECWLNRRGQLVVQVDGQEYATQIRFFLPALQEALAKAGHSGMGQIVLRTAAASILRTSAKATATANAVQLIAQEAAICHSTEISGALNRLAASMAGRCESKSGIGRPNEEAPD